MTATVVRRIYFVKCSGQMLVSVPKDSGFEAGDYVEIKKVGGD